MGSYIYGSSGRWPNFNAMLQNIWGAGEEWWSSAGCALFWGATNMVFGQNPPYFLDDFKSLYPKFFGLPTALSGCVLTQGSATVVVPSTNGLDYGQFVQAWGVFPKGTVIVGVGNGTVTLNNEALVSSSNATLNVYLAQPVPAGVMQAYLCMAWNSLVYNRWFDQWCIAMGLYIAHYCTLWAKTDAAEILTTLQAVTHGEAPIGTPGQPVYTLSSAPPGNVLGTLTNNGQFLTPATATAPNDYSLEGNTITLVAPQSTDKLWSTWQVQQETFTAPPATGASVAAQGLAGGIQTSKSVGDVSVSYQTLESLKDWGAWNLTLYGQQLVTMAKTIGAGPSVIY